MYIECIQLANVNVVIVGSESSGFPFLGAELFFVGLAAALCD